MKKVKVIKKDEVKPPPKTTVIERLKKIERALASLQGHVKREVEELKANGYN